MDGIYVTLYMISCSAFPIVYINKTTAYECYKQNSVFGVSVWLILNQFALCMLQWVFEVSTISFRHYTTKSTTYTATLAVNTFNVAQAVGSGIRLYDDPDIKLFILVGWGPELLVCCLAHLSSTGAFLWPRVSLSYSAARDRHRRAA